MHAQCPFNKFICPLPNSQWGAHLTDLLTDLLIYIGFGVITFSIGMIAGYQLLSMYYGKRFVVIAQQCSDADSVVPIIDELIKET